MNSEKHNQHRAATKQRWQDVASKALVGRRIVAVRWMTPAEQQEIGWESAAVVLLLDDDSAWWPAADDEGNDAGALFGCSRDGGELTLPVI